MCRGRVGEEERGRSDSEEACLYRSEKVASFRDYFVGGMGKVKMHATTSKIRDPDRIRQV